MFKLIKKISGGGVQNLVLQLVLVLTPILTTEGGKIA